MFKLKPFVETKNTTGLCVNAELTQVSPHLCFIQYSLIGSLHFIQWTPTTSEPRRCDDLWQHTCLEAFFSLDQQANSPYTEMNISPAGHWNFYDFSAYRTDQRRTDHVSVAITSKNQTDQALFQVEIKSPLKPLLLQYCGISVILEFQDGEKSYWALDHISPRPDFHNKMSWTLISTQRV